MISQRLGVTRQDDDDHPGQVVIHMGFEELRPLMPMYQPKITKSERLIQYFHVAVTLLHELAVRITRSGSKYMS